MIMLKLVSYFKARLEEKSTWGAIGVGVAAAAALVVPWNYVFIAVAVIGALVPTASKDDTNA
jgi:dolichol kinase